MNTQEIKRSRYLLGLILLLPLFACSDKNETDIPPENPEVSVNEAELFRSNRILIKNGLQILCWLATDNFELAGKAGQPAYVMLPSDWAKTGFTAPTFFGPPLINVSFFKSFPNSQWSMAKAPYGEQMKKGPTDYEKKYGFLKEEHKQHLDKLITICFGDEEEFTETNMYYFKDWYALSRKLYPNVLLHNNQYPGLWTSANLRKYVKVAKPDLITYDWYYFRTDNNEHYIGAKDMAEHLMTYRNIALEGLNGDSKDYLAFGQYIQGFVNQGTYKITESQLRLYYFMTLTFGGKWLNWFRYLQGDGYGGVTAPTVWSLLFENGIPSKPTIHMTWANQCNKECMSLSDYLVRLKTSDVRYSPGTREYSEGMPKNVYAFNPSNGILKNIRGRLLINGVESQSGADLYIGYFKIIPKEEQGDPDFFENPETCFFMITNGMASKVEQLAQPLSQSITFSIDHSALKKNKVYWINLQTGKKEELKPSHNTTNESYYNCVLKGGTGTLFMAE